MSLYEYHLAFYIPENVDGAVSLLSTTTLSSTATFTREGNVSLVITTTLLIDGVASIREDIANDSAMAEMTSIMSGR